jgi:DNA-binding NtrC family response regulator
MLESLGHFIEEAASDQVAVRLMERQDLDLVLAGVDPSDPDALELLTYVRRRHCEVPIVLLFRRSHPEQAMRALRLGAMAVLHYPVPAVELRSTVLQALEYRKNRPAGSNGISATSAHPSSARFGFPLDPAPSANGYVPALASRSGVYASADSSSVVAASVHSTASEPPSMVHAPTHPIEQAARGIGLLGKDPDWRRVLDLVGAVAAIGTSVLILGEPGTGKSLVARLIHLLGHHPEQPFVTVAESTMAEALSRDKTLGFRPAALGETSRDWSDEFNQARGGTLYLDEVGALPIAVQRHLLRELQYRDEEAIADHPPLLCEVRLLMSSSESLANLLDQGRIRPELYYRINPINLRLTPLRYRATDIELLAESFRARYAREFHKKVSGFTPAALKILKRHDWPGNVRELQGAIQRAVALCDGPQISSTYLAPIAKHCRHSYAAGSNRRPLQPTSIRPLKEALEEPERRLIIEALKAFNWSRHQTAQVLNINRSTLYKKLKKYRLWVDPE